MACDLFEIFKRYKGQPIEVITESGMKYCGVDVYADDDSVDIIDCKGRTVHLEYAHIEAVIEPRMRLNRICGDNDCCCNDKHHDHDHDDHNHDHDDRDRDYYDRDDHRHGCCDD